MVILPEKLNSFKQVPLFKKINFYNGRTKWPTAMEGWSGYILSTIFVWNVANPAESRYQTSKATAAIHDKFKKARENDTGPPNNMTLKTLH